FKTLSVSTFIPDVIADHTEKSLKEKLNLKNLVYTRLETKFNIYAYFHVSVNEIEYPLISKTDVWPTECLIKITFPHFFCNSLKFYIKKKDQHFRRYRKSYHHYSVFFKKNYQVVTQLKIGENIITASVYF
ncbi:hypothetical protein B7P43_G11875, partial [Cryptotermes secundus]